MGAAVSFLHDGPLSEGFHAPRELEHPLCSIREVEGTGTLVWIQPHLMRPAYELWAGDRVVATLRFKNLARSEALAASADGLWTFERGDSGEMDVQIFQVGRPFATLERMDSVSAVLTLTSGAGYTWAREGIWGRRWRFENCIGKPLLYFVPESSPQARLRVERACGVEGFPHLTFLALMGKYLMLGRGSTFGA